MHPGRWWHRLDDGRIQCDLCPRDCRLHEGQRGMCFVRQRVGDAMVLTTYGRSSGFCLDPDREEAAQPFLPRLQRAVVRDGGLQPRLQVLPELGHLQEPGDGSADGRRLARSASPQAARASGAASVAFTYNDPVIFAEYAMDTADACHALGIYTVAVTAGYMHAQPRREFYAKIDAANVDLKAFTEELLLPAVRQPPRAGARHTAVPAARDGVLVGDHHAADPRPE